MNIPAIQKDLPNTPEEVISIWLATHYERFGWPPAPENGWRYILGLERDLSFFQALTWQKETLQLSPSLFSEKAMSVIVGLFQTYVLKRATWFSAIADGPDRFRSVCGYLKLHGTFPRPIVLLSTADGFEVLDGNHRLTAFFYLYGFFKIENEEAPNLKVSQEQEAWIAKN